MENKNIFQTDNYFVLSTGRTGTTFLYHFLGHLYPMLGCFQEPPPNWFYNFASNLYVTGAVGKVQKSLIRRHFLWRRNRLIQKMEGNKYVEINPFIFGLGPFLKELLGEIKILHIIRNPLTYIPSVLNYLPPVLYRFPAPWRPGLRDRFLWNLNVDRGKALSNIEKKAWFWVSVNREIASYETFSAKYLRLKFEDLFSPERDLRDTTLRKLFAFMALLPPGDWNSSELASKKNERRENFVPDWGQWDEQTRASVLEICRPLMEEFGYAAERYETQGRFSNTGYAENRP